MTVLKKNKLYLYMLVLSSLILLIVFTLLWMRSNNRAKYEKLHAYKQELESDLNIDYESGAGYDLISSTNKGTQPDNGQSINNIEDLPSEVIIDPTIPIPDYTYQTNPSKDFLAINPDYLGWIKIPGTGIDYPYVRSMDNEDYLKLDFFTKSYSEAGTLFLDYRNLGNFLDQHMLIYGHNMKDQSMFHDLIKYHDQDFYRKNNLIEVEGLYGKKTFQVLSVYEISADDYEFTLHFNSQKDFTDYLTSLQKLSVHHAEIGPDSVLSLLTLVTCSYGVNNGRTILHAVEIQED